MNQPKWEVYAARFAYPFAVILAIGFAIGALYAPSGAAEDMLLAAGIALVPVGLHLVTLTPPGKAIQRRVWNSFVRRLPDGVRGYFREEQ